MSPAQADASRGANHRATMNRFAQGHGRRKRHPAEVSLVQRLAWAILGAGLVGPMVAVDGWHWWFFGLAVAPDLPLFFGGGMGLARGQLHPRAVPAYNLTHSVAGPAAALALGLLAMTAGIGDAVLLIGLGWGAHIALDRTCGYGLRTPQGFQR